jgi:site-specific recombinase XerD
MEKGTFEQIITEWMEHLLIQKGQRQRGVLQYCLIVRGFFRWADSVDRTGGPLHVHRQDITEWQKALFYDMGNLSNRSRATKLSAVKSFFQWLKYAEYRKDDPSRGIPSPKVQETLPQKFSTEELRLLFRAPDLDTSQGVRDMAILKTLYAAGPRVSELVNLDLNHCIDTGGYIRLQIIGGKGGKDRTVTMRTNPSRALRAWLRVRKGTESDTEAVFIRLKKGGRPGRSDRLSDKSYQNILKKYSRAVGIDDTEVFLHKMRSTFATDLYDSGDDKCARCGHGVHSVGVFEVMTLLGHEDPKTTLGYIAISERTLRKTAIPDKRFNEIEEG